MKIENIEKVWIWDVVVIFCITHQIYRFVVFKKQLVIIQSDTFFFGKWVAKIRKVQYAQRIVCGNSMSLVKNSTNLLFVWNWGDCFVILMKLEEQCHAFCFVLKVISDFEMFIDFWDGKIRCGSFHVKQAKIKQKCHPGSRISKLIFFVDSAFNSKKKSHITFFSKTSPFWSRPFWT
jgi:hypothetical protein